MKKRDESEHVERLREIVRNAPLKGPPALRWVRKAPCGITGPGNVLGVFPSSFNPPTTAHRILIETARRIVPMAEILLILDRRPLDKRIFGASLVDRLSMILLFVGNDPTLSAAFTNRGLFVEKLSLLQDAYPQGTRIRFIVGYDTLVRILDPKYYTDRKGSLTRLFEGAEFLVAMRGSATVDRITELLVREENRPFAERIHPFDVPIKIRQISSTSVRHAIRQGRKIEAAVPGEILAYIRERSLYRGRKKR